MEKMRGGREEGEGWRDGVEQGRWKVREGIGSLGDEVRGRGEEEGRPRGGGEDGRTRGRQCER